MRNLFKITCIITLLLGCSCESSLDENSKASVYITKTPSGYQLIRNGKNFFIKGTSGNSHFEELKNSGANTIRIYDTTNLISTLNRANEIGLAVILDVPVPRYFSPDTIYSDNSKMESLFVNTRKFITKYKDHPAILYWMLGNELKAPNLPSDDKFYDNYNNLVKLVKEIDKNHPISTAVGGFDRSRILSLTQKIEGLDLISINIFGELSTFNSRKKLITPLWSGPYVFSEFGVDGPWEADKTLWSVPIEQTSTKKAEQYEERFLKYIETLNDERFLGSLTFFWGHKQERTHTWFSFFSEDGKKTEVVFKMENLWKNIKKPFPGPKINYILLNGRGAQESIVLNSNEQANAELLLFSEKKSSKDKVRWEIRAENWNYLYYGEERKPDPLNILMGKTGLHTVDFVTPSEEGPYRLFVYVEDELDYYATANIPFYVLNSRND